jgi:three-Cys-motif partner protein
MPVEHPFGGDWTDQKLTVLGQYLRFFTTALRRQGFELMYIDGFAGSGGRTVERIISRTSPLFGTIESSEKIEAPGSARIALETDPPFHRMVLIERHGRRFSALKELCAQYPHVRVEALKEEANEALAELCRSTQWRGPRAPGRGVRAVLFLDPYGMNVEFETLKKIAATEAIDVWYLFPLSGVYRQATKEGRKLTWDKREAITRILGTGDWEREFYKAPYGSDLFGGATDPLRIADVAAIEMYVKLRLSDAFPKVFGPMRLSMKSGAPLFSLFFAVSNTEPRAIGLAQKAANHILRSGISSQVRPRN